MASARRRTNYPVSEHLFKQAYQFDFFQAVRLLERIARQQPRHSDQQDLYSHKILTSPVGQDLLPSQEIVRFKALPSFDFPASDIYDLKSLSTDSDELQPQQQRLLLEMQVTFMGLTGPKGVLPEHYTELLLRRIRAKDFALKDFLDLFNHRIISLFYRAWEKYRFPIAWERARLEKQDNDPFTQSLRGLVGVAIEPLSQRLSVNDDVLLYYAGLFAQRPRSVSALQVLLNDYLNLPIVVEQFQGQWLYLEKTEQTRIFDAYFAHHQHQRLGSDTVIGERIWDIRSKFRLRIGPLNYTQFERLMPEGDLLAVVCELTRMYVGPEFDFDVQPILYHEEIPACRLDQSDSFDARLGWNTWLEDGALGGDEEAALFEAEVVQF